MKTEGCPRCGSSKAMPGQMVGPEGMAVGFYPLNSASAWNIHKSPTITVGFQACLDCGHLWATIDPEKVRTFIASHGQPISRQELDELDRGPYRGLPDTTLAREIGDKVAELDAIARQGGFGLIGRYRELAHVTWDQAHREAGRWQHLSREEKLALFGWVPKKKTTFDDLDAPFP